MKITTYKVKPLVRAPLRLRIRYRWMQFRLGRGGRRALAALNEQLDREFLWGKP